MQPRVLHLDDVAEARLEPGAAFLADLGFPCHLDCAPCRRERAPSPRQYQSLIRSLKQAAVAPTSEPLRVAFFGGDPFARAQDFERLLVEVGEACRGAGKAFEAAAISDGTSWDARTVDRFFALGVQDYQVLLDGPAGTHDVLRPLRQKGSSFASVVDSLKVRGRARVVVRVDPALGRDGIAELVSALEAEGLFASPNPVALLFAAPAVYAREARELLRAAAILAGRATHDSPPLELLSEPA